MTGETYCHIQRLTHLASCILRLISDSIGEIFLQVGYPLDTIKSRLQTDSLRNPRFKSWLHCLQITIQEDSPLGIFRGVSLCLARAIPGCAVQFLVFEMVSQALTNIESFDSKAFAEAYFQPYIHFLN